MRIRTATHSDHPAVIELWHTAGTQPTVTDDEASLRVLFLRDPEALLVAEQEGNLVGSLVAAWDGWRGSFYRLAVHPQARRRGIGTALVRAGEQRLIEAGAQRLTAIVAEDERAAAGLWEAVGYERQSGRARFVRNL